MATLYDNYNTGDDANTSTQTTAVWLAQTFTTTVGYTITSAKIKIHSTGVNYDLIVELYAVDENSRPTGSALASGTIAKENIPTSAALTECTFSSSINLAFTTEYAIVIRFASAPGAFLHWRSDSDPGGYSTGTYHLSVNSGSSWTEPDDRDLLFECYGDLIPISDKMYSRNLIAIGNNEVWYESSAGDLEELVDANVAINTSNPLTVVEAFQKAFIANKENLKVVDFTNTKLTITALTTPPTRGSVVTQAVSNATMIVDFVNTAKTEIYGYTTAGVFDTTNTLSGGSMDPDTRVPSAVDEASTTPHWYDWTAYGGEASGTIVSSAYLVCRYRGRLVLSGNPNYPHQWYMSKIGDPWNWVYSTTDPLTAVAGNNTDAGEIGDIVRTLIPYGDDYLIFGCANSIHILDGDPASGGSIDELSDTTGIYSWTSWCRDDDGNLYFYGRNGIYLMQGGRGRPTNISKAHLPKLASDWAVDPTLHRIVMAYDAERKGILIFKTTIADGTCIGYFYSLETQGFYPITLQTQCGVFSAFDYNSDVVADRTLLLGSNDGYIRGFSDVVKDDNVGAGTEPISSYFGTVEKITEDDDRQAILSSLTVELAGGLATTKLTHAALTTAHAVGDVLTQATSGATMIVAYGNAAKTLTFGHTGTNTFNTTNAVTGDGAGTAFTPTAVGTGSSSDSDGCSYEYHAGNDAETCLEKMKDGAAPFTSGTLSGAGRKNRIRVRMRAAWAALKFYNSAAAETFGINKIFGIVSQKGKIK